jgi:ankyrin repeat protein
MVSEGLPLNDSDYVMQTPLYYAAKYNRDTETARLLIECGCDVHHKDANGQTCLFYAVAEGNLEMVRLLADSGANLLATDRNKERPMHYAKRRGHRHIVDFINSANRNEVRKVRDSREERRFQESSQNTVDRRKKKESTRNEYALVFTNQDGLSRTLTYQELLAFRDSSEENAKLV